MTKAPDGGDKNTKTKEREAYYVRKEKLTAFEQKNYDKIVFMRGMGGFWIVTGHSAVILANKVGPALTSSKCPAPGSGGRSRKTRTIVSNPKKG